MSRSVGDEAYIERSSANIRYYLEVKKLNFEAFTKLLQPFYGEKLCIDVCLIHVWLLNIKKWYFRVIESILSLFDP